MRWVQLLLFMVSSLIGCTNEEPWGQRRADSALFVQGYDGNSKELFRQLEEFSNVFGLPMVNGSNRHPDGFLVNVEIGEPGGVYVRVLATPVDPRLTVLIFVRSGVEGDVRKYSEAMKLRLESRFGKVIDITKSGLEPYETRQ